MIFSRNASSWLAVVAVVCIAAATPIAQAQDEENDKWLEDVNPLKGVKESFKASKAGKIIERISSAADFEDEDQKDPSSKKTCVRYTPTGPKTTRIELDAPCPDSNTIKSDSNKDSINSLPADYKSAIRSKNSSSDVVPENDETISATSQSASEPPAKVDHYSRAEEKYKKLVYWDDSVSELIRSYCKAPEKKEKCLEQLKNISIVKEQLTVIEMSPEQTRFLKNTYRLPYKMKYLSALAEAKCTEGAQWSCEAWRSAHEKQPKPQPQAASGTTIPTTSPSDANYTPTKADIKREMMKAYDEQAGSHAKQGYSRAQYEADVDEAINKMMP